MVKIYMVMQELYQQQKLFTEPIEQILFDEGIIFVHVPDRGLMKFEFGKHTEPGGFPYFVRIEIENSLSSRREFIPFGGVDSRSKTGVLNDLLVEWPHFNREIFKNALAEKCLDRL